MNYIVDLDSNVLLDTSPKDFTIFDGGALLHYTQWPMVLSYNSAKFMLN